MSMFIGNSNNNMPIVHVSKDQRTINQLMTTIDSSTIFHSSLPYIQSLYTKSLTFQTVNLPLEGTDSWFVFWYASIPQDLLNLLNTGLYFDILVKTRNSFGKYFSIPNQGFSTRIADYWHNTANVHKTYFNFMFYDSVPLTVPDEGNSTPSNFVRLGFNGVVDDLLSNTSSILYPLAAPVSNYTPDDLYDVVAVVYNIGQDGIPIIYNNTTGIEIDSTKFLIKTDNTTLDLSSYYPIRYSSQHIGYNYKSTMSPSTSTMCIDPNFHRTLPVVGWNINTDTYKISRVFSDNVVQDVTAGSYYNLLYRTTPQVFYYNKTITKSSPSSRVSSGISVNSNNVYGFNVGGTLEAYSEYISEVVKFNIVGNINNIDCSVDGSYRIYISSVSIHNDNGTWIAGVLSLYVSIISGFVYLDGLFQDYSVVAPNRYINFVVNGIVTITTYSKS